MVWRSYFWMTIVDIIWEQLVNVYIYVERVFTFVKGQHESKAICRLVVVFSANELLSFFCDSQININYISHTIYKIILSL